MNIEFIENPSFSVDFNQFVEKKIQPEVLDLFQKIRKAAYQALKLVGLFFLSIKEGVFITFSQSWVSFKHIVLGHYGNISLFRPPADIYLVVFKIVFFVLSLNWCFVTTSGRLFYNKIYGDQNISLLKGYTDQINVSHIKTNELALDASHVPGDIKVDELANIFKEINFENKDQPGYMAQTTRQEYTTIYTVEELNSSLQVFITNVKKREAFLGTPPKHDTPRLMAFYEQIESAVRLSIYKINQEMDLFFTKHGKDLGNYNDDVARKHRDLLETKARIALDLAIAGKHCGARYMGETMSVYNNLYDNEQQMNGSLSDTLIELLAKKRKEIATSQIQKYLGSDTHAFANYMGSLGEILGLPGTKNIIEHLSNSLDQPLFLHHFFEEYTADLIIDTIQEQVKKSNTLRNKMIDWVKDQLGDWKKIDYQNKAPEIIEEITKVIHEKNETVSKEIKDFKALVLYLNEKNITFPKWDEDFWEELFRIDETKAWSKETYVGDQMQRMGKVNKLKIFLKAEKSDLFKNHLFKGEPLDDSSKQEKVEKIQKILNLEEETILRILEGKTDLNAAVMDRLDIERRLEFMEHFKFDKMHEEGVSKELMEWLLVSHHILLPQMGSAILHNEGKGINQTQIEYIAAVYKSFFQKMNDEQLHVNFSNSEFAKLFNNEVSSEEKEASATEILKNATWMRKTHRYQFHTITKRDELLRRVFDEGFLQSPKEIITKAESLESNKRPFYSPLRQIYAIHAPSLIGKVVNSTFLKVVIGIYSFMLGYHALEAIYEATQFVFSAKIIPLMINHLPIQLIQTMNITAFVFDLFITIQNNILRILLISYIAQGIILELRIPRLSRIAERLNPLSLVRAMWIIPQSTGNFLFARAFDAAFFLPNLCTSVGGFFQDMSRKAEKEKQVIMHQKALDAWRTITIQTA